MRKNFLIFCAVFVIFLGLFAGCNNTMKVTGFEGFKNLPRNPVRIVFMTDQFDEGTPLEVDVPSEDIGMVADMLFDRTYKKMSKYISIDVLNEFLKFYDSEGMFWIVPIGVINHQGRWYMPGQDDLRSTLHAIVTVAAA